MQIKYKLLHPNAKPPYRATPGSAAGDLSACLDAPVILNPGQTTVISSGIAIEIPDPAYAAFAFARSGLASKFGISLANSVGVIDSDYRGEVKIAMINHGAQPFTIEHGERIAQLVIMPITLCDYVKAEELSQTQRGTGGFGSTDLPKTPKA